MNRPLALTLLLPRFLIEVVLSGWATARLIVAGGGEMRPGLARMRYGDLSETGAVALGLLITLTPGTTTVDIDPARRELLLHLLDTARAEETLATIRHRFERYVRVLFGERP